MAYEPTPTYGERTGGGKSTRNYFKGVGTRVEKDRHGKTHGIYHDTKVATKNKKGDLHFRTGGYLTNTTVRRMQTFAREHGGRNLSFSRAKGKLSARDNDTGKEHGSGFHKGEHKMTVRSQALKNKQK